MIWQVYRQALSVETSEDLKHIRKLMEEHKVE